MFEIMRAFDVRPSEQKQVLLLILHNMLIIAVTIVGKSVRDALFLTRFDKSLLPLMMCAVAVAVAVAMAILARMQSKVRPKYLLPVTAIVFAASIALIRLQLANWIVPVLYVWMEVINVLTVQQFWLLASDVCDARQAKRLFPLLGGGGSIAAVLVGWQLHPLTAAYGSGPLLWLVCGLLVGLAVISLATARLPQFAAPAHRTSKGFRDKRRTWGKYLQTIVVLIVSATVVSAILDYQFKIISSSTLRTEPDLIGFFGRFYAVTGLGTLFLQFVAARVLFQRFGVAFALLVLPVCLGLSSVAMLLWPLLATVVVAKFADQTLRFTLHNGGLELLWLPVPLDQRRHLKPLIGGTVKSIGEAASGLGIFLLVPLLTAPQLAYVALLFVGIWIVSAFQLRSLYVRQLQQAIEKHQLPPEDLEISPDDAVTAGVFERALGSGDTMQQLAALDLIQSKPLKAWSATLHRLLHEASSEVRERVLEIAAEDRAIVTEDYLRLAIETPGATTVQAIRLVGRQRLRQFIPALKQLQSHGSPRVRATSLASLISIGEGETEAAEAELDLMQASSDPLLRAAALEERSYLSGTVPPQLILSSLDDHSLSLRVKALEVVARQPDNGYLPAVIECLKVPELRLAARRAIASFPPEAAVPGLTAQLSTKLSVPERMVVVRSLRSFALPETHGVLLKIIDDQCPAVTAAASEALLAVTRNSPTPEEYRPLVDKNWTKMARAAYILSEALRSLPNNPEADLLRDHSKNSLRHTLLTLIRLRALSKSGWPVETCIQIILSEDTSRLPFVLELLDAVLPPEDRAKITPLIEPISLEQRVAEGRKHFSGIPNTFDEWLINAIHSDDEWLSLISLDFALQTNDEISRQLDWKRIPTGKLVAETVARRLERTPALTSVVPASHLDCRESQGAQDNRGMFTTLEKTMLLKSVSVFKEISSEDLAHVARIAEQVDVPAGTAIFREGDGGDCLYILLSGSVRVHKGNRELAVLGRMQSLGEMAVLDGAPRSASATALQDTSMLKVEREEFVDVMRSSPEIMQGIISLLLVRLREANDKLSAGQ